MAWKPWTSKNSKSNPPFLLFFSLSNLTNSPTLFGSTRSLWRYLRVLKKKEWLQTNSDKSSRRLLVSYRRFYIILPPHFYFFIKQTPNPFSVISRQLELCGRKRLRITCGPLDSGVPVLQLERRNLDPALGELGRCCTHRQARMKIETYKLCGDTHRDHNHLKIHKSEKPNKNPFWFKFCNFHAQLISKSKGHWLHFNRFLKIDEIISEAEHRGHNL